MVGVRGRRGGWGAGCGSGGIEQARDCLAQTILNIRGVYICCKHTSCASTAYAPLIYGYMMALS